MTLLYFLLGAIFILLVYPFCKEIVNTFGMRMELVRAKMRKEIEDLNKTPKKMSCGFAPPEETAKDDVKTND